MRNLIALSLVVFLAACGGSETAATGPTTPEPAATEPTASTTSPHLHGKWVWFELMTPDLAKAKPFYGELFGWTWNEVPMGEFTYTMIMAGEMPVGGMMQMEDASIPSHWMPYVSVDDVDAKATWVKEHGGQVKVGPMDIPNNVGRFAVVQDPQGGWFTLFRNSSGDQPDGMPKPGEFAWTELWTSDAAAARAFYKELLGYAEQTMEGMQEYTVMMAGEIGRAGIQALPPNVEQTQWVMYVTVADAKASADKVVALGGKVELPPMPVPGVGTVALFTDPTGARLGLYQPEAK